MSDFPEVIANIAQGPVAARVPEPATSTQAGHTHETSCLNCATPLTGPYCVNCGQGAHVHRTLAAFFHDLLHGVFHFEGKILHTVPLLAWRPGKLTREYIDGRRASYISPVALFLFVVFVTFALFHALGSEPHPLVNDRATHAVSQLHGQITGPTDNVVDIAGASGQRLTGMIQHAIEVARSNPDLAVFKLEYNAYKYSWLLIPLSVPFVWLLFPFDRRFHLYDHTVFATYSLSFMYVLLASITLSALPGDSTLSDLLVTALILYAPFHMYRHLRETYALGFGGAAVRTVLLAIFATFTLAVWAVLLLAMATGG